VQNNLRILILQARRGGRGMGETFAELNRESRVLKPHKSAEKGSRKFTLARQSSERVGVKFLDLFSNSAMHQSLEKSSFHLKTFLHIKSGLITKYILKAILRLTGTKSTRYKTQNQGDSYHKKRDKCDMYGL
jgi:hypothetical protein